MSRVKIGEKWSVRPERILNEDETVRVLARLSDPNLLVVETALATGARISELLGLKWKHLDLQGGIEIGPRQIQLVRPLIGITSRQQRRNRLRIQLQRRLGVGQPKVEFRTIQIASRPVHIGLHPIARGARGIADDSGAGSLHLLGRRTVTIGPVVGAGWAIGQPAVTVAQTISNYALWVIVGMVVLIVAWSMFSAWRAPRDVTRR